MVTATVYSASKWYSTLFPSLQGAVIPNRRFCIIYKSLCNRTLLYPLKFKYLPIKIIEKVPDTITAIISYQICRKGRLPISLHERMVQAPMIRLTVATILSKTEVSFVLASAVSREVCITEFLSGL